MKEFQASRLSEGNKIIPNTIKIDDFGVTLKIPGVFSGKEKTLNYQQISAIQIDAPMIGFSTITFDTSVYDRIVAKGFSKEDANEIKQLVQAGIMSTRGGNNNNQNSNNPNITSILANAEAAKAQAEADKERMEFERDKLALEKKKLKNEKDERDVQRRTDKANKLRAEGKNFKAFIVAMNPLYPISALLIIIIFGGIIYKQIGKQNRQNKTEQMFQEELNKLDSQTKKIDIPSEKTANEEATTSSNSLPEQSTSNVADAIGTYSGLFGKDQLTIVIESIDANGVVKGYDEVKGNKRALTGNCSENNFVLNEPGDDKWDGVFTMTYSAESLKGSWKANNGKSTKEFELKKE